MKFLKGFTKSELSWMMYDWANSAHSVIIVTLLPTFYNSVAGYTENSVSSISTWGYATSIAMAIVAIMAPFLGVFGDVRGMRKKLFALFMIIGALSCLGLATTPLMDFTSTTAAAGKVAGMILMLYITSVVGFNASCIYYDAFLNDITTEERMDMVSTMGYGLGYIGGSTIPLVIFLVMNVVGVPMLTCLAFIFAFTAIWWAVFSIPLMKNCQQISGQEYRKGDMLNMIAGVAKTARDMVTIKPLFFFALAYFFYIDGVHTIINLSTSYGSMLGLGTTDMMLALLLVQITGLPFCLMFIKLSEKFGSRRMIGFAILVYTFIIVYAFFLKHVWQFWVLALLCATCQGGIQALSRSMFGKLIPDKNRAGEFYGFFDIFGKMSSIMGPTLVGVISSNVAAKMMAEQGLTAATATEEQVAAINAASSPYGVLSLVLIMAIGGFFYFIVFPKYLNKEAI